MVTTMTNPDWRTALKLKLPTRQVAATLIASAVLALASATASATTITFDGLPGVTGDPLTSYTESGYTVTNSFGNWLEGHSFGNPDPSVFVADFFATPFGRLVVTAPGPFSFESLDMNMTFAGGYEISGLLGGVQQFDIVDNLAGSLVFTRILGNSSAKIDTLFIDVALSTTGSFNVDNIKVSAVPEPETYVFLAAGIGMIGLMARRRKARTTA